MSQSTMGLLPAAGLAGARMVSAIRRLVIVAAVAAFGYSTFMLASKGFCPGRITAEGEFLDANGDITETAPSCINLVLRPNGLIHIAIVAVVVYALTMVLRRAGDEAAAVKHIDHAAAVIAILVIASIIISQVWFRLIPITEWDGTGAIFSPFPFGSIEVTFEDMVTS